MEFIAGLDLGAGTTKTVIVDRTGQVVADSIQRTGADFQSVGRASLAAACEQAGIRADQVVYIAATGFGRSNFDDRSIQITDLTCAARGAHALFPDARFVLDMGAQCTRAIALRDGGKVRMFRTNEKCAAGSGGFLERVARYLEVPLDQLGQISLEAENPQPISSVCAVLAESEIINHVSEGRSVADIVCGVHQSLADRALSQLKRLNFDGPVVFIGGVARQRGMAKACEEKFGQPVHVPQRPAHVAAFGAALLGLQRLSRRATIGAGL
ncbi:MAG: acyl-CoA dehydratase activase [Phycisphaerae bacterium]|nr:acyl-CoA dehydratase activase [Phycisphaerae bacterium]